MKSNGYCGARIPLGPRSRIREPVPATPLDRITLTPGSLAANASEIVRPRSDAMAAESRTATDAPHVSREIESVAGESGATAEHVAGALDCACEGPGTANATSTMQDSCLEVIIWC